jgi:hypothetical protein
MTYPTNGENKIVFTLLRMKTVVVAYVGVGCECCSSDVIRTLYAVRNFILLRRDKKGKVVPLLYELSTTP